MQAKPTSKYGCHSRTNEDDAYPHEGALAATRYLLTESRSKIAGFTGDETARQHTLDGLGNWQEQVTEERAADRLRIERATSNAFSGETVSIYHGGLLVEQRRPTDTASTIMTYDALGRLLSTRQARHIHADAIVYVAAGNQVASRTEANGAMTGYEYFPQGSPGAGRLAAVIRADLTVARSSFDLHGNKIREWGSATAPTAFGFDAYNQLETLSTYRCAVTGDSASWPTTTGSPDVTTWVREESTGLLVQKKHADNLGPVYDYDIAGRVTRRTSARSLITDYTYTAWGQPDVTNYQDATPDTDTDRLARKSRETNGIATSDFQYSPTTLRPTLETISYDFNRNGTPELTRQIDRSHDNLRRPTGFTLKDGTTLENQATYGYSATDGRLSQISNPQISNQIFTYSYTPNSSLLDQISGPVHTVTHTWEPDRDVLDVKKNRVGSTVVSSYDYAVNSIGQRSTLSQTGTAFASVRSIAWGYDAYGHLTSADSTVTGQDRVYQYDAMGNRQKSADTLTLPGLDHYTANALNQYTSMSVGVSPTLNPLYDSDGNATAYPLPVAPTANSTLAWDAENRMISSTVGGSTTIYHYDSRSRRIAKTTGTTTALSIYDGWNVIAEYALQNSSFILHTSRLWGMDLSGTLQGAGGVGGLLCESQITNAQISNFFPTYDGNGNVSEYLSTTGTLAAHFEYDPFGNTVVNTDTTGQFNYRFSTKPLDAETGLYYYGYRYYDPLTGRWPSRDPIEERGGKNLYGFVGNDPTNWIDYLGWITLDLHLHRESQGNFGIYGTITLSSSDKKVNQCCGVPISKKTIEQPQGKTKGPGPCKQRGPFNGRLRPDGPAGGNDYNTSPNELTGGHPPAMPSAMNLADYNQACADEINTGNGGINLHGGTDASSSTGCVICGNNYTAVQVPRDQGYPGTNPKSDYLARGFDWSDSLRAQIDLNAAIACAERTSGEQATVRFRITGNPQRPANQNPQPMRTANPWGTPPVAQPVNDW